MSYPTHNHFRPNFHRLDEARGAMDSMFGAVCRGDFTSAMKAYALFDDELWDTAMFARSGVGAMSISAKGLTHMLIDQVINDSSRALDFDNRLCAIAFNLGYGDFLAKVLEEKAQQISSDIRSNRDDLQ